MKNILFEGEMTIKFKCTDVGESEDSYLTTDEAKEMLVKTMKETIGTEFDVFDVTNIEALLSFEDIPEVVIPEVAATEIKTEEKVDGSIL